MPVFRHIWLDPESLRRCVILTTTPTGPTEALLRQTKSDSRFRGRRDYRAHRVCREYRGHLDYRVRRDYARANSKRP
jgi:hypothetical protein